jgi:hypothetical protein
MLIGESSAGPSNTRQSGVGKKLTTTHGAQSIVF